MIAYWTASEVFWYYWFDGLEYLEIIEHVPFTENYKGRPELEPQICDRSTTSTVEISNG